MLLLLNINHSLGRGAKTRTALRAANNPEIIVEDPSEYTEYESETSYYEDEEEGEESSSIESRKNEKVRIIWKEKGHK